MIIKFEALGGLNSQMELKLYFCPFWKIYEPCGKGIRPLGYCAQLSFQGLRVPIIFKELNCIAMKGVFHKVFENLHKAFESEKSRTVFPWDQDD